MRPEEPVRQGKINRTIFYRIALGRAKNYLRNPQQLRELATKLKNKIQRQAVYDAISEVWDFIHCFLRLINAYVRGQYRELPLQSLLLIIACLVYFGMVADLIPDFLAGIGLIDDVALIKWTWDAVKDDIAAFRDWERQNTSTEINNNNTTVRD